MVPGVIGAAVGLLISIGFMYFAMHGALQRAPAGVIKALRRTPTEHRVTTGRWPGNNGTWNPAKPLGRNNAVVGPGSGVYRLDADHTVHLHWIPDTGSPHDYSGPIPDAIRPGSSQQRRVHAITTAVVATYLSAVAVGFGVGFAFSSGTLAVRAGWGLAGVAVAMIVIWLATMTTTVVISTRKVMNHNADRPHSTDRH